MTDCDPQTITDERVSPLFPLLAVYLEASLDLAVYHGVSLLLMANGGSLKLEFGDDTAVRYRAVSQKMELVYKVAIFDSFFNSLTRYVLASMPNHAFGSEQIVVGSIITKSRTDIVNNFIDKKARKLSRESFGTRIEFLKNLTGGTFAILRDDLKEMKRLSDTRNAIVHEGRAFDFVVGDKLEVTLSKLSPDPDYIPPSGRKALDRIAASLYEGCVQAVEKRELRSHEKRTVTAVGGGEA